MRRLQNMENKEDDKNKNKKEAEIYHEKQRLQFCLLHTLNNLFQQKDAFTKSSLNQIADKLFLNDPNTAQKWAPLIFKPHHNTLTGNYDINVLIAALEERNKKVVWFDKRNGTREIEMGEKLFGIVVNVSVRRYGGIWKSRHWIGLRKIGSVWYNLDSDLSSPTRFRSGDEVREFLDCALENGGEVLLVYDKD